MSPSAITRNRKQNKPHSNEKFCLLRPRILLHFCVRKKLAGRQQIACNMQIVGAFNSSIYAPLTKQKTYYIPCTFLEMFSLPFPFCHVVYQDKVRNEVINAKTVATVPFRSLISFHHHTGSYVYDDNQDCFLFILKSGESSTPGSGPIKTINRRGSFQMLGRSSLAATPSTSTIQDCRHRLHRWMLQASFFLFRRKRERKTCSVMQNISFFIYQSLL